MKFSIQLATERVDRPEEFLTADAIAEMARAAEGAGFDACFVTDHPIPEEAWLASGGHHALDPFVALAFAAAATSRIRLHTNLLILPYRSPFLTAKAAATLDVASGGRLILGVGAGYLAGEFAALGVDRNRRNELSDEALAALKQAWSGTAFEAAGHDVAALPAPAQRPHPPIWIGGNSKRAIRRAVENAQGWAPFPAPAAVAERTGTAAIASLDDLKPRIAYARAHAEKVGRAEPLDIVFIPLGFSMRRGAGAAAERLANDLPSYLDAGVTWLSLGVPCETRAEYCDRVRALGDAIAPLR
ncbi:MAG: TIGR03619 family F420-dependent LLM class oxidoreductase [Myxococcales bacterium]|nr:TIGR03619 family F420-dependent LLM class oxidoreductase [Myxococcales bacterium]